MKAELRRQRKYAFKFAKWVDARIKDISLSNSSSDTRSYGSKSYLCINAKATFQYDWKTEVERVLKATTRTYAGPKHYEFTSEEAAHVRLYIKEHIITRMFDDYLESEINTLESLLADQGDFKWWSEALTAWTLNDRLPVGLAHLIKLKSKDAITSHIESMRKWWRQVSDAQWWYKRLDMRSVMVGKSNGWIALCRKDDVDIPLWEARYAASEFLEGRGSYDEFIEKSKDAYEVVMFYSTLRRHIQEHVDMFKTGDEWRYHMQDEIREWWLEQSGFTPESSIIEDRLASITD